MSHRYDRTGERIDDTEPTGSGADVVRHALEVARSVPTRCPHCGGIVKPGWTVHPSCAKAAEQ